jgi:hypothetical protein
MTMSATSMSPSAKSAAARSNAIDAAFLGLARTAAQPAIAFWDYLGDRLRLRTFGQPKPVRRRASPQV